MAITDTDQVIAYPNDIEQSKTGNQSQKFGDDVAAEETVASAAIAYQIEGDHSCHEKDHREKCHTAQTRYGGRMNFTLIGNVEQTLLVSYNQDAGNKELPQKGSDQETDNNRQ